MAELMFPNPSREKNDAHAEMQKKYKAEEIELAKTDFKVVKQARQELKKLKQDKLRKTKGTPRNAINAKKKRQAFALRARHKSYAEIGELLGISPATASMWVRQTISELPEENVTDLKKLLTMTINRLIGNYEKLALEGDFHCADITLKSIDRLMKLAGLNISRQQIETTNLGNVVDNSGYDISDLNLDLDTKRKLLEAIREKKEKESILDNIDGKPNKEQQEEIEDSEE